MRQKDKGNKGSRRVAVVMSEEFVRRLSPSLSHFVRRQFDFRILSIRRRREELRRALAEMDPVGMITEWLPGITDFLVGLGYPTVVADSDSPVDGGAAVDVDDWEVGREAARYFMKSGHRRFGFLGNSSPYSDQRLEGFLEVVEDAGLTVETFWEEEPAGKRYLEDVSEPSERLLQWLEDLPKPIAIFAVHDPLGRHLCEACRTLGVRIPEEVAIVGANDDPLVCAMSFPSLSSVVIPWDRIGASVGEAMTEILEGNVSEKPIQIPPSGVTVRQSSDTFQVEDPLFRRAWIWMNQHHREPVGIAELCRGLQVSRRSLERKFASVFRKTPYQALSEMRVETAVRLLVETNEPMSLVAELAGFGDAERLAVVFRRVKGKRPSDYRRRG